MASRAAQHSVDFILNVGDSFYWGGLQTRCGSQPTTQPESTIQDQWGPVFERVYTGPGIDGKQWLGVLGNHDYGGYKFNNGWDQVIGYTWGGNPPNTHRWMMPAQYWNVKVWQADFSVDYYFVDSNIMNAWEPDHDPEHNICGAKHNGAEATCGPEGPANVDDCPRWFVDLWRDQMKWLDEKLAGANSDWQVVVTHFPPGWGAADWTRLTKKYGIDLIVSGHVHRQEVHYWDSFLWPTAYVISGGGGGITSEGLPSEDGFDDMYGFLDIAFTKDMIVIEAVSHGGKLRSHTEVREYHVAVSTTSTTSTTSSTTSTTATSSTSTITSTSTTRTSITSTVKSTRTSTTSTLTSSTSTSGTTFTNTRTGTFLLGSQEAGVPSSSLPQSRASDSSGGSAGVGTSALHRGVAPQEEKAKEEEEKRPMNVSVAMREILPRMDGMRIALAHLGAGLSSFLLLGVVAGYIVLQLRKHTPASGELQLSAASRRQGGASMGLLRSHADGSIPSVQRPTNWL
jgi:hypothetical protein